ncbi:MAG: hypothetical protein ACOX3T_08130 [Bdellovibrionota bacterium]
MNKLITFFIILLSSIHITGVVEEPNLWGHMVAGRWILAHGFPLTDHWNAYSSGIFRATSWLPEVFYALIDKYFGSIGLLFFKIILGVVLGYVLVKIFQKISKDNFFGALLGVIVLASFAEHFTLSPKMFSLPFFALSIYFADEVYKKGWNKKLYIKVFLTFAFWANSHLSSVLGVFVFCLLGFKTFDKHTYKLFLIPFLGTLFTPYFGGEWLSFCSNISYVFSQIGAGESYVIDILKYGINYKVKYIVSYGVGFLSILGLFFLMLHYFSSKSITKLKVCVLVVFLLLGLVFETMMPYALVLLSFAICVLWSVDYGKEALHLNEALKKLKNFLLYFSGEGGAFLLLCLIIVCVNSLLKKEANKIDDVITPIAAVEFIKDNKLEYPILNAFREGGYLIYNFSNKKGEPLTKVIVDGRLSVNSKKVFKLMQNAFEGKADWQEYIKYVNPKTILWPNVSPLVRILELDKENWCKVFEDKRESGFSVFIKKDNLDKLKLCLN